MACVMRPRWPPGLTARSPRAVRALTSPDRGLSGRVGQRAQVLLPVREDLVDLRREPRLLVRLGLLPLRDLVDVALVDGEARRVDPAPGQRLAGLGMLGLQSPCDGA